MVNKKRKNSAQGGLAPPLCTDNDANPLIGTKSSLITDSPLPDSFDNFNFITDSMYSLPCMLTNTQSIRNKLAELQHLIDQYKPAVIGVTESWYIVISLMLKYHLMVILCIIKTDLLE